MHMDNGRLSPRHLGYGLYWMWTLLCFQSTVAFVPFGGGLETVLSSHSEFFSFSLVATVLAHPLWAAYLALRPQACNRVPWVSATVTAASIVALLLVPEGMPAALAAVGAVSGVSSAMLDVRWLQALGSLEPGRSGRAICASICLALVGYQLLAFLGRFAGLVCVALIAVLPLASAASLASCCQHGEGRLESEQLRRGAHDARHIAGSLAWPVAGSLAFFFVGGCVQGISSAHVDFNSLHATMLAFELAAVALLYLALRLNRRLEANRIYALVMALVSAGFLALPVVINAGTQAGLVAASVLVSVGTMVIDVVVMCAITHAAFDWQTSDAIVGGVARGVTVGMITLGHGAGSYLSERVWQGDVDLVVFIVCVTYLLILCCSLYLTHARAAHGADELLGGGAGAACARETRASQGVEGTKPRDAQDAAREAQATSVHGAAGPTPSEVAPSTEDSFAARVEGLAFDYHLSRRETDVFALIARGRSIPYTAEALTISENTVRSHVRRIYDKLGVHSKQELLDLVETEREPAVR